MIEINNRTRTSVNEAFLRKVAETVLRREGRERINLSIALVSQKRSATLNKRYRKKDTVANVLAFPAGNARIPSEVEGYLGEVLLCPQEVRKEAKKYDMMFEQALAWMFIHGLLHLLGYDHKQKQDTKDMEQKERWYLSRVKNLTSQGK